MTRVTNRNFEAVVIGVSAGGLQALSRVLKCLPADYPLPVIVVQHRSRDVKSLLEEVLQAKCSIQIKQADEKERIKNSVVYFAPPDYHLLVEKDRTFSLSYDAPVHYSRPSIDVLFETAAAVYRNRLIAIILTGANSDGASGIREVSRNGGLTIAQEPGTAAFPTMPQAAIDAKGVQHVLDLNEITHFLMNLSTKP